jgi:hypothetical protein
MTLFLQLYLEVRVDGDRLLRFTPHRRTSQLVCIAKLTHCLNENAVGLWCLFFILEENEEAISGQLVGVSKVKLVRMATNASDIAKRVIALRGNMLAGSYLI